jgi:tripartite-type tricarboxylate transporter receptor subunit TctC
MKRFAYAAIALTLFCAMAAAQEYPSRAVRLVVPFAPGGASDIMARVAAPRLTELWGQPVIVENRTGADGRIATEHVAKSPPDGYTLMINDPSFFTVASFFAKLPYDTSRDFTPITLLAKAPMVLVVNASFPAKSLAELIDLAKQRPGALNFATPGNGSPGHLNGLLVRNLGKIDFVSVPYKGAAPALQDLLAGQASFSFVSVASALSNVKGGKLRALGVTSRERFAALPDTPSLDEAGLKGFDTNQWWGVVAPTGTPRPVVNRVAADLGKAFSNPEAKERVASLGAEVETMTPDAYTKWLAAESTKWASIAREAGIKPE